MTCSTLQNSMDCQWAIPKATKVSFELWIGDFQVPPLGQQCYPHCRLWTQTINGIVVPYSSGEYNTMSSVTWCEVTAWRSMNLKNLLPNLPNGCVHRQNSILCRHWNANGISGVMVVSWRSAIPPRLCFFATETICNNSKHRSITGFHLWHDYHVLEWSGCQFISFLGVCSVTCLLTQRPFKQCGQPHH